MIVSATSLMPKNIVHLFSQRYIAGESITDGIKKVKELNAKGIYATMDVLGESITNREEALAARNDSMQVLDAIVEHGLKANLSIKPTQMGLSIDEDFAYENVLHLVEKASKINSFVRIDMEDSMYTDKTINLFKRIYEKYDCVGIVLQAYLKRTYSDVLNLNPLGTNYRLCKGIYVEPPTIAYQNRQDVRDNFMKCLLAMLKNGNYVGIATHDDYLIRESYKLINQLNIPSDKFEFQMLLGVKEDLRDKINADGYKIRVYVPFGKDWYAYSLRRLKENPHIARHIFLNIFKFN